MMSECAPAQERVAAKRAMAAERRRRWQAQAASEKENLTLPSNASDIEVLAESYRHAQMRFFVALFDDSLPLGQFVAKSMLVDEYIVATAFEFLARSRLDTGLWAENVHFALMLAGARQKKKKKKKKKKLRFNSHCTFCFP
jgi:hypothetical protein